MASDDQKNEDLQKARIRMAEIIATLKRYKDLGLTPPADLLQEAQALAEQFPEIASELKKIEELYRQAEAIAAERSAGSSGSWLDSEDRRAFDALMLRDPNAALEQYFSDPEVIKDKETSENIRAGNSVPTEDRDKFINRATSIEDIYKRNALAPFTAVKAKIAELKDDIAEKGTLNEKLSFWAHEELVNQEALDRVRHHREAGHIKDLDTVKKEEAPEIIEKVNKVIEKIEQTVDGGLSAVGAAMTQAPEVIKEALEGKMEQVQAKLEQAERMNRAAAEREIQRQEREAAEAKRLREAQRQADDLMKQQQREAAAAAKALEVKVEKIGVVQKVAQQEGEKTGGNLDKALQSEVAKQADEDDMSMMLSEMEDAPIMQPHEELKPKTTSNIRDTLDTKSSSSTIPSSQSHSTIRREERKSREH